jgi:hypothetical protein
MGTKGTQLNLRRRIISTVLAVCQYVHRHMNVRWRAGRYRDYESPASLNRVHKRIHMYQLQTQ